jgi:hypothetical protein
MVDRAFPGNLIRPVHFRMARRQGSIRTEYIYDFSPNCMGVSFLFAPPC